MKGQASKRLAPVRRRAPKVRVPIGLTVDWQFNDEEVKRSKKWCALEEHLPAHILDALLDLGEQIIRKNRRRHRKGGAR